MKKNKLTEKEKPIRLTDEEIDAILDDMENDWVCGTPALMDKWEAEQELSKYHMTGKKINDDHHIEFTGKIVDGKYEIRNVVCHCTLCTEDRERFM